MKPSSKTIIATARDIRKLDGDTGRNNKAAGADVRGADLSIYSTICFRGDHRWNSVWTRD